MARLILKILLASNVVLLSAIPLSAPWAQNVDDSGVMREPLLPHGQTRDEVALEQRPSMNQEGQPGQQQTTSGIAEADAAGEDGLSGAETFENSFNSRITTDKTFIPAITVSGDVNLREEFNWIENGEGTMTRSVLRARLRAQYRANRIITFGAGIASSDGSNPRTRHVTLTDFGDSFPFHVDLAYAQLNLGNVSLFAGQIPQPLRRTDLVWDGDVNPKGIGLVWQQPLGGATLEARGLYYILSEKPEEQGSDVLAGQLAVDVDVTQDFELVLAGSYHAFSLDNLTKLDARIFRGNRLRSDGAYLSDFQLGEALATLTYKGLGGRWPLVFNANLVHNFGAFDDENAGFSLAASVGRAAQRGEWRIGAGYMQAETDAVMAVLSHDNIPLSTNYRLFSTSIDCVVTDNLVLNLTWFRFRSLDETLHLPKIQAEWANRVRANVTVQF